MNWRGWAVVGALTALVGAGVAVSSSPSSSITTPVTVAPTTSIVPATAVPAPVGLKVVPSSTNFTGTFPTTCHSDGKHPDPTCTPGSVRDTVTQATIGVTICAAGWTTTVRPPVTATAPNVSSGTEKLRAMRSYGVPVAQRSITELDHFVPLELGGSNDVTNLWAEPSDIPNAAFRNTKDHVENVLADAVCGRIKGHVLTLGDAQRAIVADWTTALARYGLS